MPAPITFLTPTSLARSADLAVDRFMKLMQAIARMINAIKVNSCTKRISPFPSGRPSVKCEYKCQLFIGKSQSTSVGAFAFFAKEMCQLPVHRRRISLRVQLNKGRYAIRVPPLCPGIRRFEIREGRKPVEPDRRILRQVSINPSNQKIILMVDLHLPADGVHANAKQRLRKPLAQDH